MDGNVQRMVLMVSLSLVARRPRRLWIFSTSYAVVSSTYIPAQIEHDGRFLQKVHM
jgi:hypothetical protein